MDLAASLHSAISNPAAAFLDLNNYKLEQDHPEFDTADTWPSPTYEDNPPRRWRLDGCGSGGTQLYITPLFLPNIPPLRIDTFLPDQSLHPSTLRKTLNSSALCHQGDGTLSDLPIARHILQGLEHWSATQPSLAERWPSLPFGSQIIIENLTTQPLSTPILLIPGYDVERKMLSVASLRSRWASYAFTAEWPQSVDVHALHLQRQLNDSVSLVTFAGQVLVFKSSTQGFYYLYHELKTLLTMPRHPNIIGVPRYLVTKRCLFGGKIGVCGFLLPFCPLGSLRDCIPMQAAQGTLTMGRKVKWARQITSALRHVRERGKSYFSDLRPDNVVLADGDEGAQDAVLIDFEQRGNWFSWSPPKIYYREYLQHLAESEQVPADYKAKCLATLQSLGCGLPPSKDSKYEDTERAPNEAWNSLTRGEQESATVYLLGKLMWCVFEEIVSVSSSDEIWRSEVGCRENVEFPTFEKTPGVLRGLISDCTVGAPEWEGRLFGLVRRGSKVFPKGREGATAEETLRASKMWWEEEVKRMEGYFAGIEGSERERSSNGVNGVVKGRPSLQDVLNVLDEVERSIEQTGRGKALQ